MVKISVVMLVYNREQYVAKAIESVLTQTFQQYEFIIVNNGSTDASGAICDAYAKKNSKIKVIHLERGNIGSGRNAGLDMACGKYITYIDDDDIVEPKMLEFLYTMIQEHDADIALCGSYVNEYGVSRDNCVFDDLLVMDAKTSVIELLNRKKYNVAMPTKLLKRTLFNEIRFEHTGKYDDITTVYRFFANAERVVAHGVPHYTFFRHGSNNSSFTTNDLLLTPVQLNEYFEAFKDRTVYLSNKLPEISDFVRYTEWSYMISMCNKIESHQLNHCFKQLKHIRRTLEHHYDEFYNSPYLKDFEKTWMDRYIKPLGIKDERTTRAVDGGMELKRIDFREILSLDTAVNRLSKPLIIYGTGKVAEIFYDYCQKNKVEVIAVCDSNSEKLGLPFKRHTICQFEDVVKQYSDFSVIIATGPVHFEAIKDHILETVSPEHMVYQTCNFINTQREEYVNMIFDHAETLASIYDSLADEDSKRVMLNVFKGNVSGEKSYFEDIYTEGQYFNDLTRVDREKCFIDAGAYTGDTLKEFYDFTKSKFDRVYCFEPFLENFEKLEENKNTLETGQELIVLMNKALYSSEGKVNYDPTQTVGSHKVTDVENEGCYFETIALDQLDLQDVSFIKMDIEGSELEALKGARNTILRSKPKLAICVYHKAMDLIEITAFIKALNLDYKFYVRHHNDFALENLYHCETVLYAL